MELFLASMRVQWQMLWRNPDYLFVLAVVPFFSIAFIGIVRYAGRPDLESYALIAPMLIALWNTAVQIAGEIIDRDRQLGTLEAIVAAPSSLFATVFARVVATSAFGIVGFCESLLVGRIGFDATLTIYHPGVFIGAMLLAIVGTSCTAMLLAGLFVLARSARIFQRALTYPFYVLGGVLVPVDLLPEWIQPLSRLVFLSWNADILRTSVQPAQPQDVALQVAAILVLAVAALALGAWSTEAAVRRARTHGTMTYA